MGFKFGVQFVETYILGWQFDLRAQNQRGQLMRPGEKQSLFCYYISSNIKTSMYNLWKPFSILVNWNKWYSRRLVLIDWQTCKFGDSFNVQCRLRLVNHLNNNLQIFRVTLVHFFGRGAVARPISKFTVQLTGPQPLNLISRCGILRNTAGDCFNVFPPRFARNGCKVYKNCHRKYY